MYKYSVLLILGFAVLVFILLFYITAPYGKFLRDGWGPSIRSKWAWMIMESPSPFLLALFFLSSPSRQIPQVIFVTLWLAHYLHRTLIYPFSQSGRDKNYPVALVSMAFLFNILNGFSNGYGIFHQASYTSEWLFSWQFITGILLFATGFYINKRADSLLRAMREKSPLQYVMPEGWLFNYVSSPHYLGEIIEWLGWAIMTWSVSGLAFFVFTFANLFPRAVSSHLWYKQRFTDYPESRKAIIPFLV